MVEGEEFEWFFKLTVSEDVNIASRGQDLLAYIGTYIHTHHNKQSTTISSN